MPANGSRRAPRTKVLGPCCAPAPDLGTGSHGIWVIRASQVRLGAVPLGVLWGVLFHLHSWSVPAHRDAPAVVGRVADAEFLKRGVYRGGPPQASQEGCASPLARGKGSQP